MLYVFSIYAYIFFKDNPPPLLLSLFFLTNGFIISLIETGDLSIAFSYLSANIDSKIDL